MFLILDFTKTFNIAILHKDKFISKELINKGNISEVLIDEIEKFFKNINQDLRKIDSIYVITGPGSFTGIRSALTFAKTMKLVVRINIFGLSKFELMNYHMNSENLKKKKIILLHFKKNQFFIQIFNKNKPIEAPQLINFEEYKIENMRNTSLIYDNEILKKYLSKKDFDVMKNNMYFMNYDLNKLPQFIKENMIKSNNLKPLYISNYF